MTTVLITGANRGIGLELAKQYADAGDTVIGCCRAPESASELRIVTPNVLALDVADPVSVDALRETLASRPIDIVINNAGIGGMREVPATAHDVDRWRAMLQVNALGPMMVAVALRENLLRGRDKKLVAVTSVLGSIAENNGGAYPYRASKAALNSMMRGLAADWRKDGVVVGIFHPGWVKTDMGGDRAPVTVPDSARGLRARIQELDATRSGTFRDFEGHDIAW